MSAEELEGLATERLENEISELAAHIQAATCRLVLMVAELDRREAWKAWGCRSCAAWLSLRCGLSDNAGREHVRVGRRLAELPLVREEFAAGRLSYSKVRAVSRVAKPETEAALVGLALEATAAQLETIVRGYRGAVAACLDDANKAFEGRHLTCMWDDDGSLIVKGRLPAEAGALLLKSLDGARDELRAKSEDVSAETPAPAQAPDETTAAQRSADALAFIAERALAAGVAASDTNRTEVVVHVEAAVLAGHAEEDGRCHLDRGPAIPAETARRLACDAAVVPLTEHDGRPLSVGRRTRSIPPAMKRALRSRDSGCRFPGCNCHRHVDAHHIEHWANGGETKLSNLVLLCRRHHRLLHEGGFRIHSEPGSGLVFSTPHGLRVTAGPPRVRGDHHRLLNANERAALVIDPQTVAARSAGGHYDLGMAVEGILQAEGAFRNDGSWPHAA